nr:PREDICTED: coiled-coil domain-containing protein 37-like [Linepithema humile]
MARKKSRVTPRDEFNKNTSHHRSFPSSRKRNYWTSGHEYLSEGRNGRKEQSPFGFPSCSQTLAHLQWWKAWKNKIITERSKKISKKQYKYEPLRTNDILERLRIETEEAKKHKDSGKAIAITDVDSQYFTELSGRPVKEKFSLDEYIQDMRDVLKTKLLIGQKKDDCIRIDQQFEHESRRLQNIQHRARRYVSGFEEFLSKDHKKSVDMLEKAAEETKLTEETSARRNELAKKFGQIRLDVYFWEENWKMVKMCQMFLYRVSPLAWRVKYDRIYKSESTKSIDSFDRVDMFGRYKAPDESASLEDLIELFEQDIADAGPAELYFTNPFDLMLVFRAMETQNLNALIHLESLAAPITDMTTTITATEAEIKQEISEISSTIDDLENSIAKTEDRAAELEEYANYLLRGIFQQLVCSEEVLHLRVFVEDTYESCVGPNDANLDSFTMMKWIERTHEELNLQLDNLPRDIVRACEREGFRQETKAIRDAEDAARKFELMHRLLDALKRIMEPPARKRRPLIRRSAPVVAKIKPPPVALKPTTEEAQYLAFFTDYCRRDDFVAYRARFPDDFDLTFRRKRDDVETEMSNGVSASVGGEAGGIK